MNLTPSASLIAETYSTPDPASFYASHAKIAGRDQGEFSQGRCRTKFVQNHLAVRFVAPSARKTPVFDEK